MGLYLLGVVDIFCNDDSETVGDRMARTCDGETIEIRRREIDRRDKGTVSAKVQSSNTLVKRSSDFFLCCAIRSFPGEYNGE